MLRTVLKLHNTVVHSHLRISEFEFCSPVRKSKQFTKHEINHNNENNNYSSLTPSSRCGVPVRTQGKVL